MRHPSLSPPTRLPAGARAKAAAGATIAIAVAATSLAPVPALALGGHDSVGCAGCHSLHTAKGERIFAVPPNPKLIEPRTNQPYTGTTAFCLYCHADANKGGQGYLPISRHTSHPYGLPSVSSRIARVPAELLGEGGRFECLSCHDAHPSNPNYRYSRVDIGPKGEDMEKLCVLCHPAKAEGGGTRKVVLFDSMDETQPPPRPAPAAGPQPAPPKPAAKPAGAEKPQRR